ncbi:putative exopolygalacturonase C [Colletotrichum trifolii]|uniref:galacturonan 1,4-alpha-galacturonidase n=1 Tax=Colletotrichum trifolii TaxID=5466 RepID=A0A4R8RDB2_COLTR|nr:putative exopolygalacturonase C [Colletotrichum trifolii]
MYLRLLSLALCLAVPASTASSPRQCVVVPSEGTQSDSPAVAEAFRNCGSNGEIVFSAGTEYKIYEPIVATNLTNVVINVQGNLTLPQDIPAVQSLVEAKGGTLSWFQIGGSNVQWVGSEDIQSGWILSHGQAWWDLNKDGEAGTPNRPHLMQFKVDGGVIKYMKSSKPIAWNFSIKGSNISISDTIIDARSSSSKFPFNTDGFDVGATDVTITNSNIFNGDDAIAINDGANNVLFKNATIGFETHGMSVGSLGSKVASVADVQNIRFEDVTVQGGLYAARFKSWIGGQGLAKNITWSNIRVDNVTFPIFVTQTYFNQASAGGPRPNNSSVMMEDFTWEHFSGNINTENPGDGSCTTDPCWYNVGLPDLTHTEAVIIECNTEKSCKNFKTTDIKLEPRNKGDAKVICMNAMPELNPDLGFTCANGTLADLSQLS